MDNSINSIEKYIENFDNEMQCILQKIHDVIKLSAPNAAESISYGMPAYKINGKPLVYFAGFKNHIGFYATPSGHEAFNKELSKYKRGKGSVQFPLNQPIPYNLIAQIVEFRVFECTENSNKKKG